MRDGIIGGIGDLAQAIWRGIISSSEIDRLRKDGVMDDRVLRGRCLCGACRFELVGKQNWVGHCHCDSCRRATASPITTWIGQEDGRWRFTGAEPARYESTPGNVRGFCSTCGSPFYFKSERFPKETHFYAALLEHPEDLRPDRQFHADEMLPWMVLADDLPHQ